jgi:hypothetical protein
MCAPCFAASRTRAMALAMFAAGSVPHCIWTSATFVFSDSAIVKKLSTL